MNRLGEHDEVAERRRYAALLVRELYDGRITRPELFRRIGEVDVRADPELAELLRLVANEPGNTWFFGVSGEAVHHNVHRIRELVEQFARTPGG